MSKLPALSKILSLKPEPQTTPTLNQIIQQSEARQTVSDYLFTPSLRVHAKKIFECVVHSKGQGFWVQAEYGAGKTSLLGTILCLLMWGKDDGVWDALQDKDLRDEYQHAVEKRKLFPIAFSMKGLGDETARRRSTPSSGSRSIDFYGRKSDDERNWARHGLLATRGRKDRPGCSQSGTDAFFTIKAVLHRCRRSISHSARRVSGR